jgi:putative sterol carrier protein
MTAKEFLLGLPGKVTHQALEGLNTKFHFDLQGEGGGQFTLAVAEGNMSAVEGLEGEPACVVKATAEDFSRLLTGELNPMMAILSGRIKISNQGEMLKMAKLFGLL